MVLDPFLALAMYLIPVGVFAAIKPNLGIIAAVLLLIVYVIWFLKELARGLTPGKRLLGLQVVRPQTGEIPGFGTMFVREVVGRFLSGVVLGVGYLWALIDRNSQAWHDKLAGTVVVKVR